MVLATPAVRTLARAGALALAATAAYATLSATVPASAARLVPAPAVPAPIDPDAPASCTSLHQLGPTTYAVWHSKTILSVKQFAGCGSRFAYAYPWASFRNSHDRYDLALGLYDKGEDKILGARTFAGGLGGPNFWSLPVHDAATSGCTSATVHIWLPDNEMDVYTPVVC